MASTVEEAFNEVMAELNQADLPEATAEETIEPEPTEGEPEAATEPEGQAPAEGEAEAAGQPEPGQDEPEGEGAGPKLLEVAEDSVVRLPDGTEVSGEELRGGVLRQADYTRKTQELAEQRKEVETLRGQMEQWYEERASDPAGWVQEIVGSFGPKQTTEVLAVALKGLADQGKLDPAFVEALGIKSGVTAEVAATGEVHSRVESLEKRLEAERAEREAQVKRAQIAAEYERQWAQVKADNGLAWASEEQEQAARRLVFQTAVNERIPDLSHAYAVLAYRNKAPKASAPATRPAPAKRQTAAVTPKAPTGTPAERSYSRDNFEDAAAAAIAEVLGSR